MHNIRRVLIVTLTLSLVSQAPAAAQAPSSTSRLGPDIAFEASFAKLGPPASAFSPYYSWEAHVAFDVLVHRLGQGAVVFRGDVQSVGTKNFGSRIGVGGAGYLMRVGYQRPLSLVTSLEAGLAHLSSHLTRDLDEKTLGERDLGHTIPAVADPSEFNVIYLEARRRFPSSRRLAPEIRVGVAPVNLRLDGRLRGGLRRPLYGATRWWLWRGRGRALTVRTEHEVGRGPINRFTVVYERRGVESGGRLQLFAGFTPGRGMHVSPDLGGVRDGFTAGIRVAVESRSP